jgi:hypothetical protein
MVLLFKKHHVRKKRPAKIYWSSLFVKAKGQNSNTFLEDLKKINELREFMI